MTTSYRLAAPDGAARTAAKDEIMTPNGILDVPPTRIRTETRVNRLTARHAGGVRPAAAACPWGAPSNYETGFKQGNQYTYTITQYGISLTSLLKQSDVKKLFHDTFPFKPFHIDADTVAPPVTNHYTVIGTAFDYLTRWWLGRRFPDAVERPWVAESAVMDIASYAGLVAHITSDNGVTEYQPTTEAEYDAFRSDNPEQCETYTVLHGAAAAALNGARTAHAEYLETGVATDKTFRAALGLVGLDVYARSGRANGISSNPGASDVEDLRRLWGVLESGDLSGLDGPVALNPEFGSATDMVGGADADIIASDTLIDIKTTIKDKFTTDHYRQLVGYWALSLIGGVDGLPDHTVKRLGVYFSRHGVLRMVPVPSIGDDSLERFLGEFTRLADRHARLARA